MKKHSVMKNLLLDILCTGIVLVIFALFHHVLPRAQESIGIVIPRQEQSTVTEMTDAQSTATIQPEASEQTHSTDSALRLASAGDKPATGAGTHASSSGRGSRRKNSTGSSGKKSTSARGVSSDKGGSALTEGAESLPLQAEDPSGGNEPVSLSDKFASHYSATVEQTENSYTSPNLAITVTEETTEDGSITYYLADLYIRDISCFQTVLAEDTYGSGYRDSILNMAALNQALLAINGDYYGNTSEGVVIRNGIIYRANPTDCDVCVLYNDGTMKVMPGSSFSVEDAVANGAWQAWTFGPALLDANGNAITTFSSSGRMISANPRTAIGYYEPGHYCMIVVDGRGSSAGITLPELSKLFEDLGCQAAYNLDGGNSSIMVWGNEIINHPSGGGRESSDALLIAEVNQYE